jgi:hypothetical protein
VFLLVAALTTLGCGDSPTGPSNGGGGGTSSPPARFEITTLITVYNHSDSGAFWSRATTEDARVGQILLGVSDLRDAPSSTNWNNEARRVELQAAVDRVRQQFQDGDYPSAFGDSRETLERYLNDADGDGWSIDGRNGINTDWPFDSNGNDPDGWTAQLVIELTPLP